MAMALSGGEFSDCRATDCNSGFTTRAVHGHCEPIRVCTQNHSESRSCSVANGSRGSQSRTCNSLGNAWGDYGTCSTTSCNDGFTLSGGQCIPNSQFKICRPNSQWDGTCPP